MLAGASFGTEPGIYFLIGVVLGIWFCERVLTEILPWKW